MRSRVQRSERGLIGLIPAIIMLVLGGAAAVVTIAVVKSNQDANKEPDVAITTRDVVASRDGQDRPHIQIKWTVAAGPGKADTFVPESKITCFAFEQSSRQRTFIAESSVFVPKGTSRDGSLTITPSEADKDVQGPVRVRCDVTRTAKSLSSKPIEVNIPAPGGGPAIDVAAQYAGKYQVVFTRTAGIGLNCDEHKNRTFTVRAPGASRISVEVTGTGTDSLGLSSFDATVNKTGQFSAEMYFDAADVSSRGLLTATFTQRTGAPSFSGHYKADDGHCEYDVVGTLVTSGTAGGLSISLEEIDGVDGCKPVLNTTSLKAGSILVTVTNNTFGFAQVFIYDGERNLVGHDKTVTPPKGGKNSFTSTFVAGKYSVVCDGPGSEDRTVDLVVS